MFERYIDKYIEEVTAALKSLDTRQIDRFLEILKDARDRGSRIYVFGNGGSGATASHFVCDLNKGCSYKRDKKFKVICLNDNTAIMLAYANDVSFDDIFVEQLKNLLEPEDVVVAISGSGNSTNVLKAIDYANSIGAMTVGLCGFDGGKLKQMVQEAVHVNLNDMVKTEDIHMIIEHIAKHVLGEIDY
jgi:D-sedoheptulose 7-phosphate isomerase